MSDPVQNGDGSVPLSPQAQEAKESMQRQLLRTMANKMCAAALEEERARRVKEMKEPDDDSVKRKAFGDLMRVQEDLVRAVNVMKVRLALVLENASLLAGKLAAYGSGCIVGGGGCYVVWVSCWQLTGKENPALILGAVDNHGPRPRPCGQW